MTMYSWELLTLLLMMVSCPQTESRGHRRRSNREHKDMYKKELTVKDCGADPKRPIHVLELTARPMPVRIPGYIRIWTTLNITEDLPMHMGVNMELEKNGMVIPTLCVPSNTCHYKDICSIVRSHFMNCPKKMRRKKIPCKCPYKKGVYHVDKLKFDLPDVDPVLQVHVRGQYGLKLQITDETNKREMGCIQLKFYVVHRSRKRRSKWLLPTS